jgi:hypothetical protein
MHKYFFPIADTFITNDGGYENKNFGLTEILKIGTVGGYSSIVSPFTSQSYSDAIVNIDIGEFSGTVSGSFIGQSDFFYGNSSGISASMDVSYFSGSINNEPIVIFSGSIITSSFSGIISSSINVYDYNSSFSGSISSLGGSVVGILTGNGLINYPSTIVVNDLTVWRSLIKFDMREVSHSLVTNNISSASFYLNLKVCEELELPLDYTIYAFAVSQSWNGGTGYLSDGGSVDGVSWQTRDGVSNWTATPPSAIHSNISLTDSASVDGGGTWYSSSICSQSFGCRTSDLKMNITPIVTSWMSGEVPNAGIILIASSEVTDLPYSISYFSENTNTIYSPHLDMGWNSFSFITGSAETSSATISTMPASISASVQSGSSFVVDCGISGSFSGSAYIIITPNYITASGQIFDLSISDNTPVHNMWNAYKKIYAYNDYDYGYEGFDDDNIDAGDDIDSGWGVSGGTWDDNDPAWVNSMGWFQFDGWYGSAGYYDVVGWGPTPRTLHGYRPHGHNPSIKHGNQVTSQYTGSFTGSFYNSASYVNGTISGSGIFSASYFTGSIDGTQTEITSGSISGSSISGIIIGNVTTPISLGLFTGQLTSSALFLNGTGSGYYLDSTNNAFNGFVDGTGLSGNIFGDTVNGAVSGLVTITQSYVSAPCGNSFYTHLATAMFTSGIFSGSVFLAYYVDHKFENACLTGSWNQDAILGEQIYIQLSTGIDPYARTYIAGEYVSGSVLGIYNILGDNNATFTGQLTDGDLIGGTLNLQLSGSIYTSSMSYTSSVEYITHTIYPTNTSIPFTVNVKDLNYNYQRGNVIRIYISSAEKYPIKNFNVGYQFDQYTLSQYLPTSSYYGIRDNITNEMVIDFDEYTQINCEYPLGNYFELDTNCLFPEREYQLLIKIVNNSDTYTLDTGKKFKIVR